MTPDPHRAGATVGGRRAMWATAALAAVAVAAGVGAALRSEQGTALDADRSPCATLDHEHAAWTELLVRYVHDGTVDYAGLIRDGRTELEAYLDSLESVCPADYETWTDAQRIAFWINAYNAYTVQLVLDHYPVDSIREIGVLPGAAFARQFIPMARLRGGQISLNEIEHGILRGELREPRIHFAIVCASTSCPELRSEAYRAAELEAQLDEAARGFVRDPSRNRLDRATGTLWLSAIFDWFREDFERNGQTLLGWVGRYADPDTAASISAGGLEVKFLDYDWSLNGR